MLYSLVRVSRRDRWHWTLSTTLAGVHPAEARTRLRAPLALAANETASAHEAIVRGTPAFSVQKAARR